MFEETGIEGLLVFTPKIFGDDRGYFFESYNQKLFEKAGLTYDFIQDNQSKSSYGVLRGLHYQLPPHTQAKLVRVTQGKVLDVAVDIREGSPSYGQHYSVILSDENQKQFMIPRGFAHGFLVLSDTAIFQYKCDNLYAQSYDAGIRFDDPKLQIDWKIKLEDIQVSEKDANLPFLGNHKPVKL